MKWMIPLLFIVLASCGNKKNESVLSDATWIDLSYSFDSTTLYWPNNPTGFEHKAESEGVTPGGFYYSSYSICAPEHGGTHLDAPIHFAANKLTADAITLEQLTGSAVLIDVSEKSLANRDYLVTVEDIQGWEKEHGVIDDSMMVLIKTGYGQFYPDRQKYFGTSKMGDEALPELHFPGIDPAAAEWLVKERKVKAVGLDTPSLDYGQSKDFRSHQVFMGANVPGFENVANLDKLPPRGSYVIALPMKIAHGSGAPLRIIATVVE